jgi:HK97 family phage major capsid protein
MTTIPHELYAGRVSAVGSYGLPTFRGRQLSGRHLAILGFVAAIFALYAAGVFDIEQLLAGGVVLGAGPTATDIVAEKASVWAQMQDIDKRATDEKRAMTQEEVNQWNALEARLSVLEQNGTIAAKQAELEQRFAADPTKATASVGTENRAEDQVTPEKRYEEAFRSWARYGTGEGSPLTPEQRTALQSGYATVETRAQGTGNTAGGYMIPPEFRRRLIETQKTFGSVRAVAEVIETETGATLPWPTMDDTANVGAILAENTQVTEQDVTLGQGTIGAYMYTSKLVRVSIQLIQDAGFDVDEWLPRVLGVRLARIQNQHFTTGTGTGQPEGLQTNATSAVTFATGNVTSVTYDGLVDLVEAVDPAYRAQGSFMSRGAGAYRKLKSTDGVPMWQPALVAGTPDRLLGYPVIINPDMPAPAASVKSILFGDFREAYLIRDVLGIQTMRLTERFADFLQVAFLAFQRTDAKPQNTAAYRAATQSAT